MNQESTNYYKSASDEELYQSWCNGDELARDCLIERYYKVALVFCLGKYFKADRSKSEDLVQTTFERIIRSVEKNKNEIRNFKAYLFTSIDLNFKEQYRKLKIQKSKNLPVAPSSINNHKEFENRNHKVILLKNVSAAQRKCLSLQAEGYSIEEISEIVGYSESSVRGLIYRGRKKIKRIWKLGFFLF